MLFKALQGIAPKYIVDLLIPYQKTRNMRSSSQMILHVPKTRLKSEGDQILDYGTLFQCILNLPHLRMLLRLD